MLGINTSSAILMMCPLGFASTWLVSQVGGHFLGPMCECFVVLVVVLIVVVELAVVVGLVDLLDVPVDLIKLLQHGLELFPSKSLPSCQPAVVVRSCLARPRQITLQSAGGYRAAAAARPLIKCWWTCAPLQHRGSSSRMHQDDLRNPVGFLAGASTPSSFGVTKPYMHWSARCQSTPGVSARDCNSGMSQLDAKAGCSKIKCLPAASCSRITSTHNRTCAFACSSSISN